MWVYKREITKWSEAYDDGQDRIVFKIGFILNNEFTKVREIAVAKPCRSHSKKDVSKEQIEVEAAVNYLNGGIKSVFSPEAIEGLNQIFHLAKPVFIKYIERLNHELDNEVLQPESRIPRKQE